MICKRCVLPDFSDMEITDGNGNISHLGGMSHKKISRSNLIRVKSQVKSSQNDLTWVKNFEKRFEIEEEGFYLNNVKYASCPAAQGAATMRRFNSKRVKDGLLDKIGIKHKGDFDQRREWIFADREENDENNGGETLPGSLDASTLTKSEGSSSSSPKYTVGAELLTKFESVRCNEVGIFDKLRICLVAIPDKRKPEFKKIIESHGGKVILDLVKNKVDILLLYDSLGKNFITARTWGIACIHPDWIENSILAEKLLSVDKFRIVDNTEDFYSLKYTCYSKGLQNNERTPTSSRSIGRRSLNRIRRKSCGDFGRPIVDRSDIDITSQQQLKEDIISLEESNDEFKVSTRL